MALSRQVRLIRLCLPVRCTTLSAGTCDQTNKKSSEKTADMCCVVDTLIGETTVQTQEDGEDQLAVIQIDLIAVE